MSGGLVRFVSVAGLILAGVAQAAWRQEFGVDVLVAGLVRPELHARGASYIEALRGQEYSLRITNPLGTRVAVALAIDGLNTIDARRTDAKRAAKWVLGPFETIEIAGWQVNGGEARRFTFTGERESYGAWLGETDNLGVIEAVFFRERGRPVEVSAPSLELPWQHGRAGAKERSSLAPSAGAGADGMAAKAAPELADEYAATGFGKRTRHEVQWVSLELEETPAATVRLRYEFRPQLEKLGVLAPLRRPLPLERRERAHGFDRYCPEPDWGR
jgi:hypothetical protein